MSSANKHIPHRKNAAEWAMKVASREQRGVDAVSEKATPSGRPVELKPIIRTDVHEIMANYSEAIANLARYWLTVNER